MTSPLLAGQAKDASMIMLINELARNEPEERLRKKDEMINSINLQCEEDETR